MATKHTTTMLKKVFQQFKQDAKNVTKGVKKGAKSVGNVIGKLTPKRRNEKKANKAIFNELDEVISKIIDYATGLPEDQATTLQPILIKTDDSLASLEKQLQHLERIKNLDELDLGNFKSAIDNLKKTIPAYDPKTEKTVEIDGSNFGPMERLIVKFTRYTKQIKFDPSKPISDSDEAPIRTRIFIKLLKLLKKSYKIKSKYIESLQAKLNQNIAQLQNIQINQEHVELTFETFTEVISNINFCVRDLTMLLELGSETLPTDYFILESLSESNNRFSKISFNATNLQDRIDGILRNIKNQREEITEALQKIRASASPEQVGNNATKVEEDVHKLYTKYILSFIDENVQSHDTLVKTLTDFLEKNIGILDKFRVTIVEQLNIINEQPIAALIKSQSDERKNVIQTVNKIITQINQKPQQLALPDGASQENLQLQLSKFDTLSQNPPVYKSELSTGVGDIALNIPFFVAFCIYMYALIFYVYNYVSAALSLTSTVFSTSKYDDMSRNINGAIYIIDELTQHVILRGTNVINRAGQIEEINDNAVANAAATASGGGYRKVTRKKSLKKKQKKNSKSSSSKSIRKKKSKGKNKKRRSYKSKLNLKKSMRKFNSKARKQYKTKRNRN